MSLLMLSERVLVVTFYLMTGGAQGPAVDHVLREDAISGFAGVPFHQRSDGADVLCTWWVLAVNRSSSQHGVRVSLHSGFTKKENQPKFDRISKVLHFYFC